MISAIIEMQTRAQPKTKEPKATTTAIVQSSRVFLTCILVYNRQQLISRYHDPLRLTSEQLLLVMKQQQDRKPSKDSFVKEGDWIELQHEHLALFSDGFKSSEVSMRDNRQSPLLALFQIRLATQSHISSSKAIHFNEPVVLMHLLSSKYLSYNANFANRSEFKLRTVLANHCQFVLKPLYKCQTARGTLIRNGESCSLSPALPHYENENVNLVLGRFQKNAVDVPIFLKKNEEAQLKIVRRNMQERPEAHLSNLRIYQLKHLESTKWLSCSRFEELHEHFVEFSTAKNGYGTLLTLQLERAEGGQEVQVVQGDRVRLRFVGSKKYLSFDSDQKSYLSASSEGSSFLIENYSTNSSNELGQSSLMKLRHCLTHKYLSMHETEPVLQQFSAYNIFELGTLSGEELKNIMFVNQTFIALQDEFGEALSKKSVRKVTTLLREIVKFMYKDKNVYAEFVQLKPVVPLLNADQQLLFAQVGFLALLRKIAVNACDILRQTQREGEQTTREGRTDQFKLNGYTLDSYALHSENNEYEDVFLMVAILITGICKSHQDNLLELSTDIKVYFEFVGKVKGSIELIYHLFAGSSIGLQILENLEFSIKQYRIKALQLLIEFIFNKEFDWTDRRKLTLLLHGFIVNEKQEKILTHEKILISIFSENRLKNIFLTLSNNFDYELIVSIGSQKEELSDLLMSEQKYEAELQLLHQQLELLCTLCTKSSRKHLDLFRDTISEEMLKKYLKKDLPAKFKSLLIKILVNIYLNDNTAANPSSHIVVTNQKKKGFSQNQAFRKISDLSNLSNRLIGEEMEMEEVNEDRFKFITDLHALADIKQQMRSLIQLKIGKKEIGDELVSSLFAMKKFIEIGICEEGEGEQLLEELITLIRSLLEQNDFNTALVHEFLQLFEHNIQAELKRCSTLLLVKIRNNYKEVEERSKYSSNIVSLFNNFASEKLQAIASHRLSDTLTRIISFSLQAKDYSIFLQSSNLLQKLRHLPVHFLSMLKNCTPIQSDLSHDSLRKLNKLYNALSSSVLDYIYYYDTPLERDRLKKVIEQVVHETNEILEDHLEQQHINLLAQRVVAEFGFLDCIVELLFQKQKELEDTANIELFRQIFKFIKLFLLESDQNFTRNIPNLLKLTPVFRYIDRGQIGLLFHLTTIKIAQTRINKFMFQCWLISLRRTFTPKVQIPLGLLLLSKGNEVQVHCEENVRELSRLMVEEEAVLSNMLHMDNEQIRLESSKMTESKEQWLLYVILVLKLLAIVVENCKEGKTALCQKIRSFLTIKTLINLIEESFHLQFEGPAADITYTCLLRLAKSQLIKIFTLLYLRQPQPQHYQYLLFLMQKVGAQLTLHNIAENDTHILFKQLMYFDKFNQPGPYTSLKEMLAIYLRSELGLSRGEMVCEQLNPYNQNLYLFINIYYPFVFRIAEQLASPHEEDDLDLPYPTSGQTVSQQEVQLITETLFKRCKEIVLQKLVYSEYVGYHEDYSHSVKTIEEITKERIGLNFNYYEAEEEIVSLLEGQEYFVNRKTSYFLDSYLNNRSKIEKYLSEAILILLLKNTITRTLHLPSHDFAEQTKDIYDLIVDRLRFDPAPSFQQYCRILYLYINDSAKALQWQPSLEYEQILAKFADEMADVDNLNLKHFLEAELKLLDHHFHHSSKSFRKYEHIDRKESEQFKSLFKQLKQRVKKVMEREAELHKEKKLLEQSLLYFQTQPLNCEISSSALSVETVLQWLLGKVMYRADNIDRYFECILEVISLLRTYTRFLLYFEKKYISAELQRKLTLCLHILFKSLTGNNLTVVFLCIEHEIWNELNVLLSLDDSLRRNLEECELKVYDLLKLMTRIKMEGVGPSYVQGILQLYNNSLVIYGAEGEMVRCEDYPLVPIRSFFDEVKYLSAMIIKEFKYQPNTIASQFFSKLDLKSLDHNIAATHRKHQFLFQTYSIASLYTDVLYGDSPHKEIAQHLAVQNAVEMTALKMHIEAINGNYDLVNRYQKYRLEAASDKQIESFFQTLGSFFVDLLLLFVGMCLSLFRKKDRKGTDTEIIDFFLPKIERVEILFQGKLYEYDFMAYPESAPRSRLKKQFLRTLNFVSNQLKRESIQLSMQRFLLHFDNDLQYYRSFARWKFMLFLANYVEVLKIISYVIVIVNNMLLLTEAIYSTTLNVFSEDDLFEILTTINLIDSLLILIVFLIKDIPRIVKIYRYDLSQGLGYFGRNYNDKSPAYQSFLLGVKVACNQRLLYNIIYALVVGLIFWDKLFASVLLLDVLAHIPALYTLLLSIWRPKFHILLTLVAYVILQYFFSILMYFLFKKQAMGYCSSLGSCFSFIFFITFKAIHGFVGYLFQQQQLHQTTEDLNVEVTFFEIFEDVYVIIIYQIMIALILAIVIDSFTVARADKLKQAEYLSSACIVCNIDRSRFNMESKFGFKGHKAINHNIFNYFDFRYVLTKKRRELMNDFELAILADKTDNWIPDGQAKELNEIAGVVNTSLE